MTTRRIYLLLLVSAIPLLSGCQLPVAILAKLFPKEKVPPKFVLPENKTILFFPDDLKCPMLYSPIKRIMSEKANELLIQNSLAAETIPYDKLIDLRNAEINFNSMKIPKIGRRVGANLVIYVSIEEFSLKDNPVDTLWRGKLAVKVRVVDVYKGRIWPDESDGFPISVGEPMTENPSKYYGSELSRKLAERMAEEICGLFHKRYVERARPKKKETDLMTPIQ